MPMRPLKWVKLGGPRFSVGNNGIYALEASLERLGLPHTVSPRNAFTSRFSRLLARLHLVRKIVTIRKTAYFIPLGQTADYRFSPATYFGEIVPWFFDSWPSFYDQIETILRRNRVKLVFFAARQSADEFRKRLGIDSIWLPEACNPDLCRPDKPLHERSIDVLELGRKYDRYHDGITARLEQLGRRHFYEKVKGQLIFPTAQALTDGFADAKVSVCFPGSMTHPARSGNCETVTLRYFESMASRCLIVGHCPAELIDIVGYNPVIEADIDNAAAQIEEILTNIGAHQEMVDRNYAAVIQRGIWDVRVKELLGILEKRGYRAKAAQVTHQKVQSR